jgi:ATP-independent RNA helicase DbpA
MASFVAVERKVAGKALNVIGEGKMKGRNFRVRKINR